MRKKDEIKFSKGSNILMLKRKRGIEMAISTIILIILGMLVLVGLLFLLNYQTGIFSDFIKNISGKSNIDSVVSACNAQGFAAQSYEFCCSKKDVKLDSKRIYSLSCSELVDEDYIAGKINSMDCENVCPVNNSTKK